MKLRTYVAMKLLGNEDQLRRVIGASPMGYTTSRAIAEWSESLILELHDDPDSQVNVALD